ncbi:MAG: hypothetical protein ABFD98_09230 [Syntrophobacteraceae bacterium]|nr:hypothetical protein [Desulfobacteraceae bacterium]
MADIIEFGKKNQTMKSVRDENLRQRKIDSLRKIFQCTRCMMKCAKCGSQMEGEQDGLSRFASPYPFCANCLEEYREYRERTAGRVPAFSYYWHNEAWLKVWESWLEHQKQLDRYRQSKEFLQLLEEVEDLLKH